MAPASATEGIQSSTREFPTAREAVAWLLRALAAAGPRAEFMTVELSDPDRWVQYWPTAAEALLNFAYPHQEDPVHRLARLGVSLPPGFTCQDAGRGPSVTFSGPPPGDAQLLELIDALMLRHFGAPPGYRVRGHIE